MQPPVEIRYEGAVIARVSSLSGSVDDGGTLFLATAEPMPVGTKLELWGRDDVALVRVVKVTEAGDRDASGMAVRAVGLSEPVELPPHTASAPISIPAAAAPTAPPHVTSGSFETPSPAPRSVPVIEVADAEGSGAVSQAVGDEGSLNGTESSGLNDVSGIIETGGPTEEYPAIGNGANSKSRRRKRR